MAGVVTHNRGDDVAYKQHLFKHIGHDFSNQELARIALPESICPMQQRKRLGYSFKGPVGLLKQADRSCVRRPNNNSREVSLLSGQSTVQNVLIDNHGTTNPL